jgi:hypothetical protein
MKRHWRCGWTRIDLAVLTVAFGMAIGLIAPAVQAARQEDANRKLLSKMRECAVAVAMSHDQNKTIPPYYGNYGGKLNYTFHMHLLPFVEETGLWNNPKEGQGIVPAFVSNLDPTHARDGAGTANLAVNLRLFYNKGGEGELGKDNGLVKLKYGQVTDGTSLTLLFATKYQVCGKDGGSKWMDPGKNAADSPTAATFGAKIDRWQQAPAVEKCDPKAGTAVSFTAKNIHVVMLDCTARTLAVGLSQKTWQAAHTYGVGDELGADWSK